MYLLYTNVFSITVAENPEQTVQKPTLTAAYSTKQYKQFKVLHAKSLRSND